jgi:hypothetical protein
MEANQQIRRAAKANGVPFWRISDELKVSEPTFTRIMRKPLSEEKTLEIMTIIDRLKGDDYKC